MFTKFMRLKELFSGKSTETDYAQSIAENIQVIDEHDHSGGKGKPIPLTAISADSDLNLQANAVVDATAINLTQTDISEIPNSSAFIDGGDLYWKNDSGNIVRITNENNLAGLSPQGEGFTDDFTDAVVSGRNLRLIRRNGTILSVTLPSTQESQNDFVSANLVGTTLTLTKRNGNTKEITLPSTQESQDDFVDASISGQVLTLTRRNTTAVNITIPTNVIDPNSVTESQDDFTSASISSNIITLTKRNGDTVALTLPTYPQATDDYVDANLANNVLTLTKRDNSTTKITLPTFTESTDDVVNVTLNQKTLVFTKRSGDVLNIVLPDTSEGTTINIDELVSKTIGGDYSSDSNATVNYSTSKREYTFKSTGSIFSTIVAKALQILNSSNSNRKVTVEGSDDQTQDYGLKMFSGLPTGERAVFLNSSGELSARRIGNEDITDGVITSSKLKDTALKTKRKIGENTSKSPENQNGVFKTYIINLDNYYSVSTSTSGGTRSATPILNDTQENLDSLRFTGSELRESLTTEGIRLESDFAYAREDREAGLANANLFGIYRYITFNNNTTESKLIILTNGKEVVGGAGENDSTFPNYYGYVNMSKTDFPSIKNVKFLVYYCALFFKNQDYDHLTIFSEATAFDAVERRASRESRIFNNSIISENSRGLGVPTSKPNILTAIYKG